MAAEYHARGEGKVLQRRCGIGGLERGKADARGNCKDRARADFVLYKSHGIVLAEVGRTDLAPDIHHLPWATAPIRWVVEVIPAVVETVDVISSGSDHVERDVFTQRDLVADRVRVRVVPFVLLRTEAVDVVIALVEPADMHIPGCILKNGCGIQAQVLPAVDQPHLVRVILIVAVIGQGAVEARCLLAIDGTARKAIDGDIGIGGARNHLRAVATASGIIATELNATRLERLDRFGKNRAVLARVGKTIRPLAVVVTFPNAARNHSRPAVMEAGKHVESEVLLVIAAKCQRAVDLRLSRGLHGGKLHATTDITVPAVRRITRTVGDRGVLDHAGLRNSRRLPQASCWIDDRYTIEGDSEGAIARVAAIASPTLLNSIQHNRVLCCSGIAVTGDVRARRIGDNLRGARERSSGIHNLAVEHSNGLAGVEQLLLTRLRRGSRHRPCFRSYLHRLHRALNHERGLDGSRLPGLQRNPLLENIKTGLLNRHLVAASRQAVYAKRSVGSGCRLDNSAGREIGYGDSGSRDSAARCVQRLSANAARRSGPGKQRAACNNEAYNIYTYPHQFS